MKKAALYHVPETRDVRAHIDREAARVSAEKEAAAEAERAAVATAQAAGKYTLEKLFAAYIAHLRDQGKSSAADAENIFRNHVSKAHPATATKPACEVTARDIVTLLRALTETGKGRTAAKLRSYLRAAYALAARAETDSDAPAAFMAFQVESNPIQGTATLSQYNRARDRHLSDPELRAYWAALTAAPDSPVRDALLLLLLLGGQRPAQLVRATVADVDLHAKTLRLYDRKGKRSQPRVHTLPLTEAAMRVIERCLARAEMQTRAPVDREEGTAAASKKQESGWLLSARGTAPVRAETLSEATRGISAALRAKPEPERIVDTAFQLRDIRRTCETALARMGVSRDVRAQIQSHGLGGIQARHYDRHDYAREKAATLAAWTMHLEKVPGDNVRQLRGRGRRRV